MSFPRYPAYKPSGVEWLGEVPEHWDVLPLKRRSRLLTEKTERRDNPVALENIEGWTGRFVETDTEFQGEGIAFESGDILFGKLRPYLAKVYLAANSGQAVGDFHVIHPLRGLNSRFLHLTLLTRELIDLVNGSTFGAKMPRASWDFLGSLPLCMPPLDEQSSITTFLDRETAKIDALIAEQQRLIELLQEKRQAVISHAVTKGLNPNAPMKDSGVEWLGKVPEHWEIMDLAKTTLILQTGPFGSQLGTADYKGEGVAVINPSNITEGSIDTSSGPFIAMEKASELERHKLYKGDLVIARRGEMGRCAVVEGGKEEKLCGTGSILVRPLAWMCTDFMAHIIRSEYSRASLSLNSVGSTMENLSAAIVGKLRIPVPPREEQAQIVDWICSIASGYQSLVHNSVRAIELLQERRSALISAAVTGQIDVRGLATEEEP